MASVGAAAVASEVLRRWEATLRWPVVDISVVNSMAIEIEGTIEGTSAKRWLRVVFCSWRALRGVAVDHDGCCPVFFCLVLQGFRCLVAFSWEVDVRMHTGGAALDERHAYSK